MAEGDNIMHWWLLVCLVVCVGAKRDSICGGRYDNVDSGQIEAPSYSLSEYTSCVWEYNAPPTKKLLINIKRVHLPSENDTLHLSVDGGEYNIPRACEQCWHNIVGEILKVSFNSFSSFNLSEEQEAFNESSANFTSVASFLITFRAFDPKSCAPPAAPNNGQVISKDHRVGSKARFRCVAPYMLVGKAQTTCIKVEDSPVLLWDAETPQCLIPECDGRVFNLTAGRGLIVHPGYPIKTIAANQHCEWDIATTTKRQITVYVRSFSLPKGGKKQSKGSGSYLEVYDGSKVSGSLLLQLRGQESPVNITSSTNRVVVVLHVDNATAKANDAATGSYGFELEYTSTCEEPMVPANGVVSSPPWAIGSFAKFQCSKGYELVGSQLIECLPNSKWSELSPVCQSLDNSSTVQGNFTSEDEEDTWNESVIERPLETPLETASIHKGSKKIPEQFLGNSMDKETSRRKGSKNFLGEKTFVNVPEEKKDPPLQPPLIENGQDVSLSESSTGEIPVYLIVSIVIPVLFVLSVIGGLIWYRRRYPMRLTLVNKFDTFENPVYEQRKKSTLPRNPAELQRLTAFPSP